MSMVLPIIKKVCIEPLFFKSAGPVADRFQGYHINPLVEHRKGVNSAEINGLYPSKFSIPDRNNGVEYKS